LFCVNKGPEYGQMKQQYIYYKISWSDKLIEEFPL